MSANYTEWDLQLVDTRTKKPIDDDTGLYNVLTASDPTELTIYSDDKGTSGSNPGTMTNGVIRFFTDVSTTSLDISVLTASGLSFFLEAVTPSMHRVDVNVERRGAQTLILPFMMNSGCDAVVDTGFDLVAGMMVNDVYVHVTTGSTANGIDIGLSGDQSGFLAVVTTTSTGWKVYDTPITTTGTGDSYEFVSGTQIRGINIATWSSGSSTHLASSGLWQLKKYMVTAATSVIYSVVATNSGGTGEGYIYVCYELNPTVGN